MPPVKRPVRRLALQAMGMIADDCPYSWVDSSVLNAPVARAALFCEAVQLLASAFLLVTTPRLVTRSRYSGRVA